MLIPFYLLAFFFSAVLASFLNVVIFRAVYETPPFWQGRSLCDHCGKEIAAKDNIPILSYLLLKGKCRNCKKKIPSLYFWTEILAGVYGVLFLYFSSQQILNLVVPLNIWTTGIDFLFYLVLIFVFIADIKYLIIPDFFIALLTLLIAFKSLMLTTVASGIIAALVALSFFLLLYSVAKKLLKKEAMGLGDIKLMLPLSLYLSWPRVLMGIFLSFILGGLFATILLITKQKKFGQVLPFGPFLIAGSLLAYFMADQLWGWYLGLLF